jgi:PAS domain S-box-containing protein
LNLIASEAKFRSVAELTSSAILVFDDNRIIKFANKGTENLFGYKQDELSGKNFNDLIHPSHFPSFNHEELQRRGDTAKTHRRELKVLTQSGQERWLDMTYGWVRFQKAYGTMVTAFDITERKNAEEALMQSEQNFRVITEMISDYAYLDRIEDDGRWTVLWVTDSFYRLTGYSVEESQAPDFIARFIYPDDLADNIQTMQQLLQNKSIKNEGRIVTKDGRIRWMQQEAKPIWDKTLNRVTYIYGAARDITERKAKEEELNKLSHELIQTEQRERKRLAQFLHDDICQRLVQLKIHLQTIENDVTEAHLKNELKKIFNSVEKTITDTRTTTFELCPPILHEFGIVAAIEWLVQKMREQYRIQLELENHIGECTLNEEHSTVAFNAIRELLLNIVKHSNANNAHVKFRREGLFLRVDMMDDGCGFEMNEVEGKIASNTSFGMFNVKQQLSSIGGEFKYFSRPGEGVRIKLLFPVD